MKFLFLVVLISSYITSRVEAKEVVIISDLDDTLRMANIEKKVKAAGKLITGVKPFEGLRAIFNEMNEKNQMNEMLIWGICYIYFLTKN